MFIAHSDAHTLPMVRAEVPCMVYAVSDHDLSAMLHVIRCAVAWEFPVAGNMTTGKQVLNSPPRMERKRN